MATNETILEAKKKAQDDFFHQRVAKLSMTFFPSEKYHEDFKSVLQKLLKFNSRKQMGVHPKTWENMCTFHREFMMPEMEVCFEIFDRCTAYEIVEPFSELNDSELSNGEFSISEYKSDEEILKEYNEIQYPYYQSIIKDMRDLYNEMDKNISVALASKINKETKLSLQLPIGSALNFVVLPNHG